MAKHCSYCGSPLSLPKRLKGDGFCSVEHSELRHQDLSRTAFERVMNLQGMSVANGDTTTDLIPAPQRSLIRLWIYAVAGLIAAVALAVMLFSPASSKNHSAVSASVRVAPVASSTPVSTPAVSRSETLKPAEMLKPAEPPLGTSKVSIEASAASWVVACADGKVAFAKLFNPGTRQSFDFVSAAIVRAGNPMATHIEVNGKPVNTPVPVTGVGVVDLTPNAAQLRKGGEPDDCTKGL